jgi:hypothetical protein
MCVRSLLNLSRSFSSMSGAGLTALFGVTETDNSGLLALTVVCNLLLLAPVPLLLLMPPGAGILCTDGSAGSHWGASGCRIVGQRWMGDGVI